MNAKFQNPESRPAVSYRKSEDNSFIQCFLCGRTSHNRQDAIRLFCGHCGIFHTHGIVEPAIKEADRQTKIIVALFLVLGKAVEQLNAGQRNKISVRESEIRDAWNSQKSPVRIVSEMSDALGYYQVGRERVFNVVLGDLDMKKTGLNFSKPMPEEPKDRPKKVRVFDLE
ncbi:hypothetical protein KGP36_02840 [Patescibacteria group bacterium]|nr:hypothetical protein [Patescibacteria group bacterium]